MTRSKSVRLRNLEDFSHCTVRGTGDHSTGKATKQEQTSEFSHSGFFVLRTPLLPFDELISWSSSLTSAELWEHGVDLQTFIEHCNDDVELLRGRLLSVVERPEITQALFIASPSLQSAISRWKVSPDSKKGLQAQRALVRYYERMSCDATPFGLFSGCTVGTITTEPVQSILTLKARDAYRTHSRVDAEFLLRLTRSLCLDPELALQIRYAPNSSRIKVDTFWHYTALETVGNKYSLSLFTVEDNNFLSLVMGAPIEGLSVSELSSWLLNSSADDISYEVALAYVQKFIRDQILVPTLTPLVTGRSPIDDIITQLDSCSAGKSVAEILNQVKHEILALDQNELGRSLPSQYRDIGSRLKTLPVEIAGTSLFQVDMTKPAAEVCLTPLIVEEVVRGVDTLARLCQTSEPSDLSLFKNAFYARYQLEQVPLLEALDEELGVGFGLKPIDSVPLLNRLPFHGLLNESETQIPSELSRVQSILLNKLLESRGNATEVELSLSDLPLDSSKARLLPNALSVKATLIAQSSNSLSSGDFQLFLSDCRGPSGARLLGRFCSIDSQLEDFVRIHVGNEEVFDLDALYAEIVYLGEARTGNIQFRPVLREYELVYLGRSGAPASKQIPLSDLFISLVGDELMLYSKRLSRRVIPRLTSAHKFSSPLIPAAYRFLCSLQNQNTISLSPFSWGPFESLTFLPRVRIGRLVLAPARWLLSTDEVHELTKNKGALQFASMLSLRQRRGLPRWLIFDGTLPVDLNNPLSVDAFIHLLKKDKRVSLEEMVPTPTQLCVESPEGCFNHELIVPLVRSAVPQKAERKSNPQIPVITPKAQRQFVPGSDWLYLKLDAGLGTFDELLANELRQSVQNAKAANTIVNWFFVRYPGPQYHLRIRFQMKEGVSSHDLLQQIVTQFTPMLSSGRLWKFQVDTYEREIERYGGLEGAMLAERLFTADSDAVLDVFFALEGDLQLKFRFEIAILGTDMLLNDLGFDLADKIEAMGAWGTSFENNFGVDSTFKRALGEQFRRERSGIDALLSQHSLQDGPLRDVRKRFEVRSSQLIDVVKDLRALRQKGSLTREINDIASSYVHMHINRLMRAAAPQHEIVLYDMLRRFYIGQRARQMMS